MTWELFLDYDFLKDLGISLAIILICLIFRRIFAKYIFALLMKISRKAQTDLISYIFLSFEKPVQWLVIIAGVYGASLYFPHFDESNIMYLRIMRSALVFIISWGLFNLSSKSSILLKKMNKSLSTEIDEMLIPFISNSLRIIIVLIGGTIIAKEFGYEISGLVAGLGIGGLAVSLAAKDALANLFGGIAIISEKPFTIGNWIKTPSVEGIVEEISFRSTRVRTFAQALVTVPNATLANESITNWSQMGKRQITFSLKVTHDTTKDKLKNVTERIDQYLRNHPDVHQETILVRFDQYLDNGLGIYLNFFTVTTALGEFMRVKEDINFAIMDILEEEGVYIAIPTRKLYVDPEADGQTKLGLGK